MASSNNNLSANDKIQRFPAPSRPLSPLPEHALFTDKTRCFVYGLQPRAVQGMLDFDFICKRAKPSVAGIIYTFGGQFVSKMYWGTSETLLPVYQQVDKAMAKHPDVDVVVNFASSRSVYSSTMELMENPQIKTIAIIAEGVPERRAREIAHVAQKKGVTIIGPATVGGIKPGSFKIGNTGGMMDNIVASKLYRKGSVGYVSKSGGMSNELNNIIAQNTDGVYEGIAIGGDRYPGTTFIDHLLRYQSDPECKILVLLGEVGGVEEYKVIEAVKEGVITKPIVAWAIGTCASMFKTEVQFGHAGSFANSQLETAAMKNQQMREAGFHVPETFEELPSLLKEVYDKLVKEGTIVPQAEPVVPKIPIDYSWAQELGLVRKPAAFISTISDDRGQELLYAGMPISDVFREDIGIGGVMSLLWFRRRLPVYASKFLEMVLMLTADHGPAVSGAMNTIITTRAGKDLISALVSGLLTIGSRFGGALDGAAEEFTKAFDKGLSPREFVDGMRKANKLIPGIGHRVKSRNNPDLRVELVKEYVMAKFPSHKLLDYALAVESVTTSKKDNLILNVDGCIAVCFVDLLRNCGAFSAEEAEDYLKMGVLNGLFVLGRSIGLIAHYLDQKRLRTGLYRHPWDDITYLLPNLAEAGAPGEGRVEVSFAMGLETGGKAESLDFVQWLGRCFVDGRRDYDDDDDDDEEDDNGGLSPQLTSRTATILTQSLQKQKPPSSTLRPPTYTQHRQNAPGGSKAKEAMSYFRITLHRSAIGLPERTRGVLAALGLRRRMQTVFHPVHPQFAGMILKVKELVRVQEVDRALSKQEVKAERTPDTGFYIEKAVPRL
ncbi:ATP-citrate synthase subunit 1 [Neonectria ditissima]|uniref:Large ribosomal subunit protein uL30m n=1 Tax=Neonectria ditissima TaxID=78410 RepID=A0A0P7BFT8_9HYPO|nr:ATP-citrate synthase subunit 1 [Neonectria ditissima]